jgi:trehalose/maltose transport system substrate-binding protein
VRKIFIIVLSCMLIAVLASLGACGQAAPPSGAPAETPAAEEVAELAEEPSEEQKKYEGVELRIMVHAGATGERPIEIFANEFFDSTGARVVIETVPWENIMPKLMASIEAGDRGYDIYYSNPEFSYTLWPHLLPLNEYIERFNYDTSDWFDSARKYGEGVGQDPNVRFTIPASMVVAPVFYNTEMIPEYPNTWDGYNEILGQITNPPDSYGLAVAGVPVQTVRQFYARFWSLGDPLLTPDWQPNINNENGVLALEMLKNTFDNYTPPGVLGWDNPDAGAAFANGLCATYEGWTGNVLTYLQDPSENKIGDNWAVASYPEGGTGNMTDNSFAIMRSTKNPDAAFEFIAEFTSLENSKRWAIDYALESPIRAIYDDPEVQAAQPWFEGYKEALDVAKPAFWRLPQWVELFIPTGEVVSQYLSGEVTDPQAALDRLASTWEDAIRMAPPDFEYSE